MVVFLGRREVAGIRNGTTLVVEGMIGERRGRLAMLNPGYQLLSVPESETGCQRLGPAAQRSSAHQT